MTTVKVIDRFSGVIETHNVPAGIDPATIALDALEPWTETTDSIQYRKVSSDRIDGHIWEIVAWGESTDIYATYTRERS